MLHKSAINAARRRILSVLTVAQRLRIGETSPISPQVLALRPFLTAHVKGIFGGCKVLLDCAAAALLLSSMHQSGAAPPPDHLHVGLIGAEQGLPAGARNRSQRLHQRLGVHARQVAEGIEQRL